MKMNATAGLRMQQWLFCACLLLVGMAGLTGCASKGGPGDSGSEIVTDSDEPEVHRRARIRLELAVGYFEQGQITIALDELKQALAADPSYAEAYSLRGLIYMRLNDFRFSEESFRKALELNPRDSNVMHNLGWLFCQQARYPEAQQLFSQALANPQYGERAKTLRAQGLCQVRAAQLAAGEQSLLKSYEFDAGNPVTAYNLATLLFQRGDFVRAQFYVRRLNNSELANAESLWLGVKVERRLENRDAMQQLAAQLMKRFPKSREAAAYQRGAFDE
ncbi:MAG: type IV pilus biogenesis/stability protein PilW [Rhodoferax sp.]|uniref:type IV pilus biogenesis/stability protein PilW n=1 Tax=Rhodoferax sp. TaxID=50421 RepID=UPI0026086A3F|nr:type IV pilus biogenesis/stability protein PilW [Rhodoferax sp.]MDD5335756.1 type IV pilus biogenesis/stability protein PilW [Rhodoferax sp.]